MNKTPRDPISVNPRVLLIYSLPKIGKSTIMAGLTTEFAPGKSVIISNERGGYDWLKATVEECYNPFSFNKLIKEAAEDEELEYIVVDTITTLDEWSEVVGTYDYMRKPQGKRFNLNTSTGTYYKKDDPEFDTVYSIPEGYGYRYSRNVMVNWLETLRATGKKIILVAHVKDKYIATLSDNVVSSVEINLTGKLKEIYCTKSDAVAMLVPEGNKRYLNFQSKDESKYMGSRPKHLKGKILISESYDDLSVKTFWENIFLTD